MHLIEIYYTDSKKETKQQECIKKYVDAITRKNNRKASMNATKQEKRTNQIAVGCQTSLHQPLKSEQEIIPLSNPFPVFGDYRGWGGGTSHETPSFARTLPGGHCCTLLIRNFVLPCLDSLGQSAY
uniref:Uncharacterized protein n=1 Tax=Romanomermis culicivorax TaxID=13658 RepID=A0A915KAI2_ROMCU